MLLTITTTHQPASDLSYLLHKHPDKLQEFSLSFGKAQVFYPEVSEERCTAALMLDIDPLELVKSFRGRKGPRMLEHYINDRPFVASSFLSVAIANVFRSAMSGRSRDRQHLCDLPIPLELNLSAVPVRGGHDTLEKLFVPLGYEIHATQHTLDETEPDWGPSHYFDLCLTTTARLRDVLNHLYVLIPVLDKEKHYYISEDEVEKLLKHGEGWLPEHPGRDLIVSRYLKFQRHLKKMADTAFVPAEDDSANVVELNDDEQELEKPINLNKTRYNTVINLLIEYGVRTVLDLGCGEGRFLKDLLKEKQFTDIVGVDISSQALGYAEKRLRLHDLPDNVRERIRLLHGSLIYKDSRLAGYDAACCLEVIEHMELDRMEAFERVLFGHAQPRLIIITTPNREYNAKFENLGEGKLRHPDHRFEWTRGEFKSWIDTIADRFPYSPTAFGIGDSDTKLGEPTQGAVFEKIVPSDQ